MGQYANNGHTEWYLKLLIANQNAPETWWKRYRNHQQFTVWDSRSCLYFGCAFYKSTIRNDRPLLCNLLALVYATSDSQVVVRHQQQQQQQQFKCLNLFKCFPSIMANFCANFVSVPSRKTNKWAHPQGQSNRWLFCRLLFAFRANNNNRLMMIFCNSHAQLINTWTLLLDCCCVRTCNLQLVRSDSIIVRLITIDQSSF